MTHPTLEEWMAYLYGEVAPKPRKALATHLRTCAECRATVARWQGTMKELSAWRLPRRHSPAEWLRQAARWAAAAILLLGLGYGIGRLTLSASPDVEALRQELEPLIRENLREELGAERQAALEALRAQLASDLSELTVGMFSVWSEAANQSLAEFVQSFDKARREERLAILAGLRQLEWRRLSEDVLLRNGLETLARLTGDEFLRTRQDIVNVAALVLQPVSDELEESESFEEGRPK